MSFNSNANTNPTTGVRYGVIACNSLNQDLVQELFHGPDAVDVTYQEAYDQAKAVAVGDWENHTEDAETAASETDHHMTDSERESFIEKYLFDRTGCEDCDEFVEQALEEFSDCYQADEPLIQGEVEGIKYQISWLGGAPLLWVLNGPSGFCNSLCSPCVPNAADLDSGFSLNPDDGGFECYVVPEDWLAKETV